ncbi:sensor histidine kinase [Hymenobacter koreensis]|uniref:histidine kinase n=1 Tax=Hymenobacter koreensis TaxID=1084523 RepID=A0ABP8JE90_9BACT
MSFKITARTLLHLGAELISSDAVAFYELIKNAFDARSPRVDVYAFIHFAPEELLRALTKIAALQKAKASIEQAAAIQQQMLASLQYTTTQATALAFAIRNAESLEELHSTLEQANYLEFRDRGEGMSLAELSEVYLTIGTRSRRRQRASPPELTADGTPRPILGEKGLGRLSVMRLGEGLLVETSKRGEAHYNELAIDWGRFSHDSDALLDSIDIEPTIGKPKPDPAQSGTTIKVYKLHATWSREKLEAIAREELSKFLDPFSKQNRTFIKLWFNDSAIVIPNIERILFEKAHAYVEANFSFTDGEARLTGSIDYRLANKQKTFALAGTHLLSTTGTTPEELTALGPFAISFHWYNRAVVEAMDGIGTVTDVRNLIRRWAGGLMVFRDGFRVNPYGGPDDDWLRLDQKALGAQGYKVNRRQIIGKVDISAFDNPALLDQTNREGLRDCPEKSTLIRLLQYIMWSEFKAFLDKVDKDRLTNQPLNLSDLEVRLEASERKLTENLQLLVHKHPEIKDEEGALQAIREAFGKSRRLFSDARTVFESYEQRRDETLHLAALGLMVDIIAHELNRSTEHALTTLGTFDKNELPARASALIKTLQLQLKTLQTRLKVLDPLGPTGRNRKDKFDLRQLVHDTVSAHESQFNRHHIQWAVEADFNGPWTIKAVPGMFVQILENCIANSVYWLNMEQKLRPAFSAQLTVRLDKSTNSLLFTDNGPGIPKDKQEEIFWPFFTTKPPGDGKGLGLYISREIARYHGVTFSLSPKFSAQEGRLNTFQLDISSLN